MSTEHRYTREVLEEAVASSRSWRGVRHRERYDIDEMDPFFVLDAELNAFWIPFADVAGYGQISVRSYRGCLVAERGQWLTEVAERAD